METAEDVAAKLAKLREARALLLEFRGSVDVTDARYALNRAIADHEALAAALTK